MSPIIVALDFPEKKALLHCVDNLDPTLCRVKIGKEAFTRFGPDLVEKIAAKGFDIFLDLKFHDIPTTVAKACLAAADLGVWMMNVHAQGGRNMMETAREALMQRQGKVPLLIAVTVLTSFSENDLFDIGITETPLQYVERLMLLAEQSGLDGVVCSAAEVSTLKKISRESFLFVTPGIRLASDEHHDQQRVMTPEAAMAAGSDYLVIGRSITMSDQPNMTLQKILEKIS